MVMHPAMYMPMQPAGFVPMGFSIPSTQMGFGQPFGGPGGLYPGGGHSTSYMDSQIGEDDSKKLKGNPLSRLVLFAKNNLRFKAKLSIKTILPMIAGLMAVIHVLMINGLLGENLTNLVQGQGSLFAEGLGSSFGGLGAASSSEMLGSSSMGDESDRGDSPGDDSEAVSLEAVDGEALGATNSAHPSWMNYTSGADDENGAMLRMNSTAGELEWHEWMDYPLTIGTAVVSEDFHNFVNWLESIERLDNTGLRVVPEESVRVVVYDVGLSEYHRNLLEAGSLGEGRARPASIVQVRSLRSQLQGIGLGQSEVSLLFATRALILASLLDEFGAISKGVVYMDVSTFVQSPVDDIAKKIAQDGFIATAFRKSPKRALSEMVHPTMLDSYPLAERWRPILDGKIIGCDAHNEKAVSSILKPWLACVSNWQCVSPPGASEENHRYDLSSLSCIMYSQGIPGMTKDEHTSVSTAKSTPNLLEERRKDMWGRVIEMNSARQAITLTGPVHEAEITYIKGHVIMTIVVAVNSDTETLSHVLELVNNIGAKERGTRRGNIVGLGSYERACRIVIYDLGLTEAQNKMLSTGFQESLGENAIIKPFKNELKQFPQHAQFSDRSHTNAYKAVLINDAVKTYGGFVVWLDPTDAAGKQIYIKKPLDRAREQLMKKGFISVLSAGTVGSRVHSGMLEAFEVRDREEILDLQNLDSRVIGFNANNQSTIDGILKPWVECCLDQMCIAPPGSSRGSHQFEQSALTLVTYMYGLTEIEKKKNDLHIDAGTSPAGH